MSQSHGKQHPILHLIHGNHGKLEHFDRRVGQADIARTSAQMVSGTRAFRDYAAFSNKIKLNTAGNLRGMVLSAKWRTAFVHVSHVGEYMENIGYLAAISSGIADSAPKIDAIYHSSDPAALKAMKISGIAGTIAQRALVGAVPAGVHLIYRSLEGWCLIAGLAGGRVERAASQGIKTLRSADALVSTTFRNITDTNNQANAVWSVINITTSPINRHSP